MKLRHITVVTAAVAMTTALSGCGGSSADSTVSASCKPAHTFSTVTKGTLTVSTYDLPPFSKLEGKTITGVDGALIKAIAKKECLTITAKPAATAAVIPTVQAGRADLAVGDWYRTAERAKIVALSDPLYTDQMALISKEGYTDIGRLKGKTVGTVDGYLWVNDMKKFLGGDLKVYSSTVNMNQDLKTGRIDVGIDSYGSGKFNNKDLKVEVADSHPEIAASQEGAQASFPVPLSNKELLAAINEDIADLHKSGELAKILTANGLDATAADTGSPRLIQ